MTFGAAGAAVTFEERVTQPLARAHVVGVTVTVYRQAGIPPTTKNPNDAIGDALLAAFSVVFPLAFFLLAIKFLRHRDRLYGARPGKPPIAAAIPEVAVVARGRERVMTTAERLKADEERARQVAAGRSHE